MDNDLEKRYDVIDEMIAKNLNKMEAIYNRDKENESIEYFLSQMDVIDRYAKIQTRLLAYRSAVFIRLMESIKTKV